MRLLRDRLGLAAAEIRPALVHPFAKAMIVVLALFCAAPGGCGGSGGGTAGSNPFATNPTGAPTVSTPNLTENDVNTIVLQAMNEATARGAPATIAVVDRVGNVLAVTQMANAPTKLKVTSGPTRTVATGLENPAVPLLPIEFGALSKALTGAYLSSNGNAFTTRTANQIVQEHFDPGVRGQPAGPLFGVQFSQLPCSDFNRLGSPTAGGVSAGPHRSPLGFSADSGGLPIYKNGVLAGGIGVMSTSTYSFNPNIFAVPIDNDEVIAIAGVTGFEAPAAIQASNIAVGGLTLQYTDASPTNLAAPVSAKGSFTPFIGGLGFSAGGGSYYPGPAAGHTAIAGTTYGDPGGASGVVPDGTFGPVLYPGTTTPAFVFTDGAGNVLYSPTTGKVPGGGIAITAAEAQALMTSTLNTAFMTRAAIRIPTNSFAQVTVTIVDLDGNVLAQARTPDAPVFGADVSRQKARSALFFSRTDAAATINALKGASLSTTDGTFANYITRSKALVEPTVFSDGIAWSEVGIGDISRPFYPDGIDGSSTAGSLSLPFPTWSVFSTGLQVDLIAVDLLTQTQPKQGCAFTGLLNNAITPGVLLPTLSGGITQLANGLQIFSGGFPIYRGTTLVGGIGISGDGIQQDSLISFLGLQNGPSTLNHAPGNIRADTLSPQGIFLRYVNCPVAPFLNSSVQNPC
jgi:uncharacterized protein GlcG (DUF336 family)